MRACGILLPVFSLPSPWGIGTLGEAAYAFVDFLVQARQSVWQVLPLGPTSYGDSPYQSFSSFAGNPYLIDLGILQRDGLLEASELPPASFGAIDYGALYRERPALLRRAAARFVPSDAFSAFCAREASWLDDYARFMAQKDANGGAPWQTWQSDDYDEADAHAHRVIQFWFAQQWDALKRYANDRGIALIGDLPIYAALDSCDVWANREQFLLDCDGYPIKVAGCPPDSFTADGQTWGNPLFRWDVMRADGYRWWTQRLRAALTRFDRVRIDHFRAFAAYYAIPAGDSNARGGAWCKGPGMELLHVLSGAQPELSKVLIAEDLGYLDDDVRNLLRESGLPGMKLLQFAFDSREDSDYLPHNYTRHTVVYPGTHDNDTLLGWSRNAPPDDVRYACRYLGCEVEALPGAMIRAVLASVADLAIIPMQDYLGLGSEARINTPSTADGNWCWRMDAVPGAAIAQEVGALAALYGRAAHG